VFSVSRCTCDRPVEDSTFGYYIGSVSGYRRDPEGTAVALSCQRRHAATLAIVARLETAEPAAMDADLRGVAVHKIKDQWNSVVEAN
jgi:hypothetical protein